MDYDNYIDYSAVRRKIKEHQIGMQHLNAYTEFAVDTTDKYKSSLLALGVAKLILKTLSSLIKEELQKSESLVADVNAIEDALADEAIKACTDNPTI